MPKLSTDELVRDLRARRIMVDGGNGNVYDVADEVCEQAADWIEQQPTILARRFMDFIAWSGNIATDQVVRLRKEFETEFDPGKPSQCECCNKTKICRMYMLQNMEAAWVCKECRTGKSDG